ncbi:hypothetical protein MW290_10885 [Aquincola tertiaricarbonis]|uniref:Secreted protein n=1 Tax=Aquincola tertiaricarbonis TaxID=391953 RepID=A0ABY4S218_AQUTE|nr:hypothetical protein [Aquincola tertiaricarbonis]URI06414.1 hypothetical protein MW290_10885 [Aquincola tertiaricarbonis]
MHPRLIAFLVALVLLCTGAAAHVEPLPLLGAADALELACGLSLAAADEAPIGADGGGLPHSGLDGLGDAPGVLPAAAPTWPSRPAATVWRRGRAAAIPLPPYLDGLQRPPCLAA